VDAAEPPKLYGPPAPVIVPKTSDSDASVPDNLKSLMGVLGKPESSTFYHSYQDQQWSSCNIMTVDIKYYIKVRKSYNSNFTNYE